MTTQSLGIGFNGFVSGIASDADGSVWVSIGNSSSNCGCAIVHLRTDGVRESHGLKRTSTPTRPIIATDGTVWFADSTGGGSEFSLGSGTIDRIDPGASPSSLPLEMPSPVTSPRSVAIGSDGRIWVASANGVGHIDSNGANPTVVTMTPTVEIVAGPDGNLWATSNGAIIRITPAGVVTSFAVPGPGELGGIVVGPDANLWFTMPPGPTSGSIESIGRITPGGTVTVFGSSLPRGVGDGGSAGDITSATDGSIYSAHGDGGLWRTTVNGVTTQVDGPMRADHVTATQARLLVVDGGTLHQIVPDGALPAAVGGGGYNSVTPQRLADTAATEFCDATDRLIDVTSARNVPRGGISTAVLTVTIDRPTEDGYVTVWPDGQPRPSTSALNFTRGQTVSNTVVAKVGPTGIVRLANYRGCARLVVDIVGWTWMGTPIPGALVGVDPQRILDTGTDDLCANRPRSLRVTGAGGIPAAGAAMAIVNLTVDHPDESGYLTVWPHGENQTGTSVINFAKGQTIANTVFARIGIDGTIDIANFAGCARVVVDVWGWSSSGTAGPGGVAAAGPYRAVDTGPAGLCSTRSLVVDSRSFTGTNPGAATVVLTVTVDQPSDDGYVVVWPGGTDRPTTSSVNFTHGQTVATTVLATKGPTGTVEMAIYNGCARLVIDVSGETSPSPTVTRVI